MENTERKFNWGYLILGILFIITSLIAFNNPESSLLAIAMMFGFTALFKGIFELVFRNRTKKIIGKHSILIMVMGIVDIIIGLLLLFDLGVTAMFIPYFFAIWFIWDSIGELVVAGYIKNESKSLYWFTIIMNILGVVLGIMLLFNPISSALTLAFLVGFYFMITGINYIVSAFNN